MELYQEVCLGCGKLPSVVSGVRSASRLIGALAVATFFAWPLVSIWLRDDVSWGQKGIVAAVLLTSAVAPWMGATFLALLLPGTLGLARVFGGLTSTPLADALVLAAASGFATALSRPVQGGPPRRLAMPALVFGAAVVTRVVQDLVAQAAVAPARPFWTDLLHHIRYLYWTEDFNNWLAVHDGWRWAGMLMIGVGVERALAQGDLRRRAITWLWVASAAAATTFAVVRVTDLIARAETTLSESLAWVVTSYRASVLFPDPNAAGSIYGWLLVTALLVFLRRRLWWMAAPVMPLLVVGFGLARSRAAVGAVLVVLAAQWLMARRAVGRAIAPVIVSAALAAALALVWMFASPTHGAFGMAAKLRVQMADVGARMAWRYPMFGVGLSDYARTSRRFTTSDHKELNDFAPNGENAHNNFLQILVELGAPAFLAFAWLVVPVAAKAWRPARSDLDIETRAMASGLTAFLVTALFGHPLLIPEVAALFSVGLGLAAAGSTVQESRSPEVQKSGSGADRLATQIGWAGAAFFVASLLWRT